MTKDREYSFIGDPDEVARLTDAKTDDDLNRMDMDKIAQQILDQYDEETFGLAAKIKGEACKVLNAPSYEDARKALGELRRVIKAYERE